MICHKIRGQAEGSREWNRGVKPRQGKEDKMAKEARGKKCIKVRCNCSPYAIQIPLLFLSLSSLAASASDIRGPLETGNWRAASTRTGPFPSFDLPCPLLFCLYSKQTSG